MRESGKKEVMEKGRWGIRGRHYERQREKV